MINSSFNFQYLQAQSLFHGYGETKNIPQALQLFNEAEGEGCVKSSNYLGRIYLKGEGVRKNLEKAHQVCDNELFH
jgi:pentatricopeptide repeat protein